MRNAIGEATGMTEDVLIACINAAAEVTASFSGDRAALFSQILNSGIETAGAVELDEAESFDDEE